MLFRILLLLPRSWSTSLSCYKVKLTSIVQFACPGNWPWWQNCTEIGMVSFICCFCVQKFLQGTVLTSRSHGFWVFITRAGRWANWLAVRTNYFVLLLCPCRGRTVFLIKKSSSKFLLGWKQVAHYEAKHFEELFKVALSSSLCFDPKFYAEDEVL